MIEFATNLIIQFIENTGYFGVFILMTLESALIPIPSEITMPFAGFLVQRGELNLLLVILTGAFANLFGSLIAYGVDYYLEEHVSGEWQLVRRPGAGRRPGRPQRVGAPRGKHGDAVA